MCNFVDLLSGQTRDACFMRNFVDLLSGQTRDACFMCIRVNMNYNGFQSAIASTPVVCCLSPSRIL